MARALRIEYENAFYHVIQRGIERKNIFSRDADKDKFLSYLNQTHTSYGAIFHGYALMDNHYHIIIETPRANLSKIMHFLNTSYAVYFNTKTKRVGPLYQGRYKAILVQEDGYLHHLSRYIHLNPVRSNLVKDPIGYPWSSYKYFVLKEASCPRLLNTGLILSMFDKDTPKARKLYKEFVFDGIGKEDTFIKENTIAGFVLGDPGFLEKVKSRFAKSENYEVPVLNQLRRIGEPALEQIKKVVQDKIPHKARLQRKLAIYLSRKLTQNSLMHIADFYGDIRYSGVSQIVRRVDVARLEDKQLDNTLRAMEKQLI